MSAAAPRTSTHPFRDLFAAVRRCLDELGYPPGVIPEGVEVPLSTGQRVTLPIVQPPPLPDLERDIMEAFWGLEPKRPLRGPEVAKAVGCSLSLVKRALPRLLDKGLLSWDKRAGYYLLGTPLDGSAGTPP